MLCLNKLIKRLVQLINLFAIGLCVSVTRALSRVSGAQTVLQYVPQPLKGFYHARRFGERPANLYVWRFI